MRGLEKNLLFLILFLIVITPFLYCEKRNLATPLSRLGGHWKLESVDWYFGPLDLNTLTGSFIFVYPEFDEKRVREQFNERVNYWKESLSDPKAHEILKKVVREKLQKQDEVLAETLKKAKERSGVAVYAKYKMLSQVPDGEKIEIEVIGDNLKEHGLPEAKFAFYIDKSGKKMVLGVDDQRFEEAPLLYVDQKISPDDIK